jgi:hypothetical protein
MKGTKTGGRTKGTPNKLTEAVTDLLNGLLAQGLSCDPVEFLARVVAGDKEFFGLKRAIPFGVRLKAAIELAPYRASKRKAIELTGAGGASPVLIIPDKQPNQTWEQRAEQIRAEQQKKLQELML